MAERIQLRRTKGWRKPEGAIVVARPSKWGNHWRIVKDEDTFGWRVVDDGAPGEDGWAPDKAEAQALAVDMYRTSIETWGHLVFPSVRADLAGKDLACWCRLDQPCHADVLLELANGSAGPIKEQTP